MSLAWASTTTNIFAPRVPYTSRSHPVPTLHVNTFRIAFAKSPPHLDECLLASNRHWTIPPGRHADKATTTMGQWQWCIPTHLAIRFAELLDPKWSIEATRLQAGVNVGNLRNFQDVIFVALLGGKNQQIPTAQDLVLWIVSFRSINLQSKNPLNRFLGRLMQFNECFLSELFFVWLAPEVLHWILYVAWIQKSMCQLLQIRTRVWIMFLATRSPLKVWYFLKTAGKVASTQYGLKVGPDQCLAIWPTCPDSYQNQIPPTHLWSPYSVFEVFFSNLPWQSNIFMSAGVHICEIWDWIAIYI